MCVVRAIGRDWPAAQRFEPLRAAARSENNQPACLVKKCDGRKAMGNVEGGNVGAGREALVSCWSTGLMLSQYWSYRKLEHHQGAITDR